jgi:hypothetical protein
VNWRLDTEPTHRLPLLNFDLSKDLHFIRSIFDCEPPLTLSPNPRCMEI